MEVRTLAAPKLAASNLGSRLRCYRPCRRGPPRMEVEELRNGQIIVGHNYGHGGAGWTLAPGAARHVNSLLLEVVERRQQQRQLPHIHIIGAGVLSLFTAYDLVKRGHRNISIVAEQFEELASHNAGGLLAAFATQMDGSKVQELHQRIAMDSYNFYAKIARGEDNDFGTDVAKFVPAYFDVGATAMMDVYVRAGVMQPPKPVLVRFGSNSVREWHATVFDDGIFIEPLTAMRCLRAFLDSSDVQFIQQRVDSFYQLKEAQVIVNCTGMGARELCGDEKMHSVQGHLILLKDQNPTNMDYMLVHMLGAGQTESGQTVDRFIYVFPKRSSATDQRAIGVLGGTFVEGADKATPNDAEFELLLRNANDWLTG